MKRTFLLLSIIGAINLATAQQVEHTHKVQGNVQQMTLVVQNIQQDIEFLASEQGEIKIIASAYKGIPEKAKGLVPLSAVGPDNTGTGVHLVASADKITLSGIHKSTDNVSYKVLVPKNMRISVDMSSWYGGNATFKGFTGELEVKSQIGNLSFIDVTGPIVASTLSGEIAVVFNNLNQTSPTSLASTSGEIDITLPSSTKANFKLSTMTGEVYTDLPFTFPEEKAQKKSWVGTSLNTDLNGGGVAVNVKNISGNIYIRKSK